MDVEIDLKANINRFGENVLEYGLRSKIFDFQEIGGRVITERYKEYQTQGKYDLAQKTLSIKIKMERSLNLPVNQPPNQILYYQTADIYF